MAVRIVTLQTRAVESQEGLKHLIRPRQYRTMLGAVTRGLGVDDCAFVQAYVQQACKYRSVPGAVVWWI